MRKARGDIPPDLQREETVRNRKPEGANDKWDGYDGSKDICNGRQDG